MIEADGLGDQPVPAVAEARRELLLADVQCRTRAMQAMQRIAAEVLTNYSTFASRDDTWETMELWQHTLQQIQNSESKGVEVHTLLEHCLCAFLIIQAHAITSGEPMLLLTPDLFSIAATSAAAAAEVSVPTDSPLSLSVVLDGCTQC